MSYFLSIGELVSGEGCNMGDYHIDWHLGSYTGDIVFVSGNAGNTDEDIDADHPLDNEVVVGGTLYPVIRYVYVDGEKYAPVIEEGSRYSPDLQECLTPVEVDEIDCDTEYNADSNYDFILIREVGVGEKNRSIKFNLGATTNYVAWAFDGKQIPDQLNIYYCTGNDFVGEIIDSMRIGGTGLTSNFSPSNYPRQPGYDPNSPVTPIIISATASRQYISDMRPFTYQAGDWLRFEIEGNILNPSEDETKWTLKIKCFDSLDESNNFADCGKIDITSLEVEYDTINCRKELRYNCLDSLSSANNNTSIFLRRYLYFSVASSSFPPNQLGATTALITWLGTDTFEHRLNVNEYVSSTFFSLGFSSTQCVNLAGTVSYVKSGNTFVISFTDSDDYDLIKTNIDYIQAHARWTAYLGANTDEIEYYAFYVFYLRVAEGCDLSYSSYSKFIHWSTPISYDYPNSITFTLSELENNYPTSEDPCNTRHASVNTYVGNHNILYAEAFSYSTKVRAGGTGGGLPYGRYLIEITANAEYKAGSRFLQIYDIMANNLIDLESYGFCYAPTTVNWQLYVYYDKIYMESPDNYTLERRKSLETNNCEDTDWELVASVSPTTTTTTTTEAGTTTTTTT